MTEEEAYYVLNHVFMRPLSRFAKGIIAALDDGELDRSERFRLGLRVAQTASMITSEMIEMDDDDLHQLADVLLNAKFSPKSNMMPLGPNR